MQVPRITLPKKGGFPHQALLWGLILCIPIANAQEIPTPTPTPKKIPSEIPEEVPEEKQFCPTISANLLEAALTGQEQEVLQLLENPLANPNEKTSLKIPKETLEKHKNLPKGLKNLLAADQGITPLMAAASYNLPNLCKKLIEKGAIPRARNGAGFDDYRPLFLIPLIRIA